MPSLGPRFTEVMLNPRCFPLLFSKCPAYRYPVSALCESNTVKLCLSAKIIFSSSMSGCRLSARTDETSVRQNAAPMMPAKTLDPLIVHPSKLMFRPWRLNLGKTVKPLYWVIVAANYCQTVRKLSPQCHMIVTIGKLDQLGSSCVRDRTYQRFVLVRLDDEIEFSWARVVAPVRRGN